MLLHLHLQLVSDGTFGRGDGVVGLVDEEIEHDAATGLPFMRGRTLKGLLVEECANILFALGKQSSSVHTRFSEAARFLFWQAGSTLEGDGHLHVGMGLLPIDLREAVKIDIQRGKLTPTEVMESLTAIRRQTAVDEATGAPDGGSLRSMRVVLRDIEFIARIELDSDLHGSQLTNELALLAACVLSLRRAGTGRNRGRGRVHAWLVDQSFDESFTANHFAHFRNIVTGKES